MTMVAEINMHVLSNIVCCRKHFEIGKYKQIVIYCNDPRNDLNINIVCVHCYAIAFITQSRLNCKDQFVYIKNNILEPSLLLLLMIIMRLEC